MTRVYIIHGTGGSPEINWFPWLADELRARGCDVVVPRFPTPKGHSLESWRETFRPMLESLNNCGEDEEIIFVAHSLGPAFVLDVLENLDRPALACFFVAGFLDNLDLPEFDRLNGPFTNKEFDWERIKDNSDYFFVYGSDDDPYVPFAKTEKLATMLGTQAKIVKRGGHFNDETGWSSIPFLLDEIEKLI